MATTALSFRTPAPFRAAPSIPCPKRRRSLRVSAENSEGSSSSSSSVAADRFSPSPPPGFRPPEPKRFSVRPDKFLDILGASLSLPFRLGTGAFALGYSASLVMENEVSPSQYFTQIAGFKLKETSRISELGSRPEKPIEIYDFEGCPFCRKVREVASVLDLDILYYPCPRNGPNFRPQVLKLGGKTQFPYMVK